MNEIEEWFLEEFGHLGFSLTPTVYDPESFMPYKKIMYENTITHMRITPDLANDLNAWSLAGVDHAEEHRQIVVEQMLNFLRENKKDFKPTQKLNRFKL